MKKLLSLLLVLSLFLVGCEPSAPERPGEPSEPSAVSETSQPQKEKFPVENEVYTYTNGDHLFELVCYADHTVCFRFYPVDDEDHGQFAFTYTAEAEVGDGCIKAECVRDFFRCTLELTAERANAKVEGEAEAFSGQYTILENEPKEYPLPEIPAVVLDENAEVKIDRAIANAVRTDQALPKDAYLTKEILRSIRSLNIYDETLVSLTGIESLEGLESIDILFSYLTDISPLLALPRLRRIDIGNSYITKLPVLDENSPLERLSLSYSGITDLSPLKNAVNLKELCILQSPITSISPLKDLHNLELLGVWGDPILDWETIKENDALIQALAALDYDYDLAVAALDKAKEIVSEIVTADMNELQKEKACYDYIRDRMEYQIVYGFMKPFGYQALIGGKGVCGAYAEGLTLLLNVAGIESVCAISDTHAWSMAKIDGKWYHVDALWDEGCGQYPAWFNVGTATLMKEPDHVHDVLRYGVAADMHPLVYAPLFGVTGLY